MKVFRAENSANSARVGRVQLAESWRGASVVFKNMVRDESFAEREYVRPTGADMEPLRQLYDVGVGAGVGTEMRAVSIDFTLCWIENDQSVPVIVGRKGLLFDGMNDLQRPLESKRKHGRQEKHHDRPGMRSDGHQ